ncbi:MAG: hypothetical protein LBP32_05305, partial [Spirochaetaceae bacterium]|nr:hypothetical protein [Spirochaetaceae bacterium]
MAYTETMFTMVPCAAGCGRTAVTGSLACAVHVADRKKEAARLTGYILERRIVKDLNAAGLHFDSVDFSG